MFLDAATLDHKIKVSFHVKLDINFILCKACVLFTGLRLRFCHGVCKIMLFWF